MGARGLLKAGGSVTSWIDGVDGGTITNPAGTPVSTTAVSVGQKADGTLRFEGALDNVRYFTGALSPAEILAAASL